jgi:hypothetical protein
METLSKNAGWNNMINQVDYKRGYVGKAHRNSALRFQILSDIEFILTILAQK